MPQLTHKYYMKEELREKFKIKRRFFGTVVREEADRNIAEYFMEAYSAYESFFIYHSCGTETDTRAIISALINGGKRVYLPRVEGENIVPVPYGELKKGKYGIMEPTGEPYRGAVDVTVVPLLAINGNGYRLGYGGGFYDRYLKGKKTLKVGLGYAFQLTDELCEDGWDEPLDSFICERGIYYFGK